MTIHVPVTQRVSTRIDFDTNNNAVMYDIADMYGEYRVKGIRIGVCEASPRMVVELTNGRAAEPR